MRALFVPDLHPQDHFQISGDPLHHLVNVTRLEKGEELLLIDGKGLTIRTTVDDVSKKHLTLKTLEEKTAERKFAYDLALGIPKKEALELSLKQAVELGFRRIFLVRAAYSQTRLPERDRMTALLVSALEQSNSSFLPELVECDWKDISWNDYGTVLVFDSQKGKTSPAPRREVPGLIVVGPEGGFSPGESAYFMSQPRAESLLLPTPILRTPTAVAAGAGVLLQRLMS